MAHDIKQTVKTFHAQPDRWALVLYASNESLEIVAFFTLNLCFYQLIVNMIQGIEYRFEIWEL